jgi:hypothetical protein
MLSVQVQYRISDQLSWPVISDVSTAMNSNELCPNLRWIAFQILFKIGVLTVGEYMLMLEQQKVLIYAMFKHCLLNRQRFGIRNTTQPSHM